MLYEIYMKSLNIIILDTCFANIKLLMTIMHVSVMNKICLLTQ